MALATRVAGQTASGSASDNQFVPQIHEYKAGEDIETGMPVYLKASDKKLYRADGTADDEKAHVLGFASRTVKTGMVLTVYGPGAVFGGYSGMTPRTLWYLATTPGRLNDAATGGGSRVIARSITETYIQVIGWF